MGGLKSIVVRFLYLSFLALALPSCSSKRYTKAHLLPDGIKSATEETYAILNDERTLLHKKEMTFTRNGRIKYSKTVGPSGNALKETEKKIWFTEESYPGKESYYCKTRWKPKKRERISCYTKKKYKQNEVIYHYNKNGSIQKITDYFPPFYTQLFYYTNNSLSKIVTTGENNKVIDEISVICETKDEKGTCLKEIRISNKTGKKEEIHLFPNYE